MEEEEGIDSLRSKEWRGVPFCCLFELHDKLPKDDPNIPPARVRPKASISDVDLGDCLTVIQAKFMNDLCERDKMMVTALGWGFVPIPLTYEKNPQVCDFTSFDKWDGFFSFYHGINKNSKTGKYYRVNPINGNVGILCGSRSGVFVVDIDVKEKDGKLSGECFYYNVIAKEGAPTVVTGSGGWHVYFKWEDRLASINKSNSAVVDEKGRKIGVDIMTGDAGQVLFPGSIHPITKKEYKWMLGKELNYDVMLNPMSDELYDFFTKQKVISGFKFAGSLTDTQGNVSSFHNQNIPQGEIKKEVKIKPNIEKQEEIPKELFEQAFELCCEEKGGFGDAFEIDRIEGGILCLRRKLAFYCDVCKRLHGDEKTGKGDNPYISIRGENKNVYLNCRRNEDEYIGSLALNYLSKIIYDEDIGAAEAFAYLTKGSIFVVYNGKTSNSYAWLEKEKIWGEINESQLLNKISEVLVNFIVKKRAQIDFIVKKLKDEGKDKDGIKRTELETRKLLAGLKLDAFKKTSILKHVMTPALGMLVNNDRYKLLNSKIHLLPVAGGKVIDLETGEVRDRIMEDYLTYEIPTKYTGKIDPVFLKFINDIFLDSPERVDFMRRALGYSITGYTREKKLFIMQGDSNNGKSALFNLLEHTLGRLYAAGDSCVMNGTVKDGRANNSLYRVRDARIITIPETEQGDKFIENEAKRLTGSDTVTCRPNYGAEIQFQPQFKLWIATNHTPACSLDQAMLTRLCLIKFPCEFVEEPSKPHQRAIDTSLIGPGGKLGTPVYTESCLSWLVSGAIDYCKAGKLVFTEELLEFKKDYILSQNNIEMFLSDGYIIDIPEDFTPKKLESETYVMGKPSIQFMKLYSDYKIYCSKNALVAMSDKAFGKYLKSERTIKDKPATIPWKVGDGKRVYFYFIQKMNGGLL